MWPNGFARSTAATCTRTSNYSTYLETKAKRLEIQGAKDAKLAKRLKNELDWVRSSPKARQAKNKARLERYDQMENEARNNKKLDFSEIQIPAGPRLGSTVLEANHIHKPSASVCSSTTCPSRCRATASSA